MIQIAPGERYECENGWSIDVHEIRDGEVYARSWPPGVDDQSYISNLIRIPLEEFIAQIERTKHIVLRTVAQA